MMNERMMLGLILHTHQIVIRFDAKQLSEVTKSQRCVCFQPKIWVMMRWSQGAALTGKKKYSGQVNEVFFFLKKKYYNHCIYYYNNCLPLTRCSSRKPTKSCGQSVLNLGYTTSKTSGGD